MKPDRKVALERLRRLKKLAAERKARERKEAKALADPAAKIPRERRIPNAPKGKNGSAVAPPQAPAHVEPSMSAEERARSNMNEQQRQLEIDALERDVTELSRLTNPTHETAAEVGRIRREVDELKREFYTHLGAWQRLQLARHPQRPYTEDYIRLLFENFSEVHGDRNFADDAALITGMAWYHGRPVMIVGSQKGRDTKQRLARNFGQAKPEGYRKALRAMQLAAKFRRPILVFIDTQGAYPGVGAEERGQAEAIAHTLREMSRLAVPILVTITGEGGSGGALATAVGDRVFMLENSVYSVISPEGCASIMWRDSTKAEFAAEALKITATDLLGLKLIDEIVPEPEGGAHLDHPAAARLLDAVLYRALKEVSQLSEKELLDQRYDKFRQMGQFFT
jgi:acetyl-CoA carboxylase carboxyl transferase subunit alpha